MTTLNKNNVSAPYKKLTLAVGHENNTWSEVHVYDDFTEEFCSERSIKYAENYLKDVLKPVMFVKFLTVEDHFDDKT
jgi:hypothetical protein